MRGYLISVLLTATVSLCCLAVLNYAVDPLNRIRPNHTGAYLKVQEREMNPGVARSLKYDTVVIGSSMMENLDPAYIENVSSWKAINLAVEGSTAYEQRRNLEVALHTGQVRRVIWGVDWGSFSHAPYESSPGPGVPDFLYEDLSIANFLKYVFNLSVLRDSFKRLAGVGMVRQEELGRVHNWNSAYQFGCRQIDTAEARFQRIGAIAFMHHKSAAYHRSLDINFLAMVDGHPDVMFYALIPPYSAQWLHSLRAHNQYAFDDYLGFRRYLATMHRPNLRFFDFMSDASIITDGRNYRDLGHFQERINQLMFRRMFEGEHLPVMNSIDLYADLPMKC